VAIVNGTPISRTEYDIYVKNLLQGKQQELTPEQKNQVLDELISMQLLAAQADKDGLEKDPDTAAQLQVLRMRVMADAESQKFLKGQEPTDAELHAEYDSAIAGMDKNEYHARHILVATKDQADQIIKKLKGGAKFEELAKSQSIDGSKTNGGDLGWFTLARMVKPFGDAVKGLKKGEYTQQPVQTQFGWHVIKLEDTRDVRGTTEKRRQDRKENVAILRVSGSARTRYSFSRSSNACSSSTAMPRSPAFLSFEPASSPATR
jgi:peptidyl-prolyl cis-trans isomerase C